MKNSPFRVLGISMGIVTSVLTFGLVQAVGQAQKTVTIDTDQVMSVACSPDGRLLAGGGFDKAIKIWDASTGELVRSLEGPKRTARRGIAFSPDAKSLIGGGDDGLVHIWNVMSGALERSILVAPNVLFINSLAISPDGRKLAVSARLNEKNVSGFVKLLNLETGNAEWTWNKLAASVMFSPNGKTLAVGFGEVHLLDATTGMVTKRFAIDKRGAHEVAYSPDGRMLAAAGGYQEMVDGGIRWVSEAYVWDVASGKLVHTLAEIPYWLRCIAYSPDGKFLATGSSGSRRQDAKRSWTSSEIRLWDTERGKLVRSIPGELSEVNSMAFTPDGKSLLSCDGQIVALTETLTGLRRLTLMNVTRK